jgi:hypothetical protein
MLSPQDMLASLPAELCVTAAEMLTCCRLRHVLLQQASHLPSNLRWKGSHSLCHEQGLELHGPMGEAARRWTSQPALARISSVSDPGAAAAGLPNVLLRAPSNIEQTMQADAGEPTQHVRVAKCKLPLQLLRILAVLQPSCRSFA